MKRLLDTNVRFFDEGVVKAQLLDEWGSMVKVLDEVLVNGTETRPLVMIKTTQDEVDPDCWLATITVARPHKYTPEATVIEIAGSDDPTYNGIFRVQDIPSETSFTIAISKSKVPDQPSDIPDASNMTVKLPPLGYEKVFLGPNKGVYRSKSSSKTRNFLRVDDNCPEGYNTTWLKFARVSIYTDMKHADDFYPSSARLKAPYDPRDPNKAEIPVGTGQNNRPGWSRWYYKTSFSDHEGRDNYTTTQSGATAFNLIGDNRTFYFLINNHNYHGQAQNNTRPEYIVWFGYAFGEFIDTDDTSSQNNTFLCCTLRSNQVSERLGSYNNNPGGTEEFNVFSRTRVTGGKITFNSESLKDSELSSVGFSFEVPSSPNNTNGALSGRDIGFSFNKNNFTLNFMKPFINIHYPTYRVLKGYVRGYHMILNNLFEYTSRAPVFKEVVSNVKPDFKKKFIILKSGHIWGSGLDQMTHEPNVAFELNDWE